jgi:hypothetical protein
VLVEVGVSQTVKVKVMVGVAVWAWTRSGPSQANASNKNRMNFAVGVLFTPSRRGVTHLIRENFFLFLLGSGPIFRAF